MKVAIVGAGPGGLCAIKNCLSEKIDCVAFEQSGKIGGTWNYNDKFIDKNGHPEYSCMYAGLTTNLPKELMEMDGFRYRNMNKSFISQRDVLDYIQEYADFFDLSAHISFYHRVRLIEPVQPGNKWLIKVRNLLTNDDGVEVFDAVIVSNGNYSDPFYPCIDGMEYFDGHSIHSHYFRKADEYEGKNVLVVGGGPSGMDIASIIGGVAKKVYLSVRKADLQAPFRTTLKPEILHFERNRALFLDGTKADIDEVIYCTGYNYCFPFLSENCKIQVDKDTNYVSPLYKHLLNIEYPTMAFPGVVTTVCPFPVMGIQVRFFLAFLKGRFSVSKMEMYEDVKREKKTRPVKDRPERQPHIIAEKQLEYTDELANIANIPKLAPVIGLMFKWYLSNRKSLNVNYNIINDRQFEVKPINI